VAEPCDDDLVFGYVTVPHRDAALAIGRHVVEQRLAACANVLPSMTSIYRWKGQIQTDDESVLILKTRRGLQEKLSQLVVALHSYDCPCVVFLPVRGGNPAFLDWLKQQTEPVP
jgi:periplasmic divalent cation tolerance protein